MTGFPREHEVLEGQSSDGDGETWPLLGGSRKSEHFLDFGHWEFLEDLSQHFGSHPLWVIFFVQHLLKGFVRTLAGNARPYLLEHFHISGPMAQQSATIVGLPWVIKPMMGLMSDLVPIGGIKKAPYMLLATLVGVPATAWLGVLSNNAAVFLQLTLGLFCGSFHIALCDLLSEAKYTEMMGRVPQRATALMAYVQFGMTAGSLLATILVSPALLAFGAQGVEFLVAGAAATVMGPLLMGYMEEDYVTAEELRAVRHRYWEQREILPIAALLTLGSFLVLFGTVLTDDPLTSFTLSFGAGCSVVLASYVLLTPVIGKFMVFTLATAAANVSISGAAFYFYTDDAAIFPTGPNFSVYFYNTIMGGTSLVVTLLGTVLYQRYLSTWSYRHVLVQTNVASSLATLVDVIVFARLNRRIGVPDSIAVLGGGVLATLLNQLSWMPQVVCFAALCPKGMEATMFALLAGATNLGSTVATSGGSALLQILDISPTGEEGDPAYFENLWAAGLIAALLPTVVVLLCYRLVPDARPGDIIVHLGDATSGSPWRTWWKNS